MKTANSIRALLLVLTSVLVPGVGFAQTSYNQPSDSQTLDNQTLDNLAPDNMAPDNQAPDYQGPANLAPDQTADNRASDDEVSVASAPPPPLPSYEQPPVPGPGYLWTPGYWAYGIDAGYYWVPGTWVLPPVFGVLWTPGYWGWGDGLYIFHRGYWGPHIGFYGGINYGCGYFGVGFAGGYWRNREFFYNRAVTNIRNTSITNVYNTTVVNRIGNSRVSHNGGPGGVNLRPTAAEQVAARAAHYAPTNAQRNHEWAAHAVPALRASVNHGQPSIAATARPGVFAGQNTAPRRAAEDRTHATGRSVQGATGSQLRGASINRAADRPPWANGNAAHDTGRVGSAPPQQFQRNRSAIAQPTAAYRPGPSVRTGDYQRAQTNTRPPASRPTYQASVGSMHTASPGYDYPRAARQPPAHWSAPARPAPSPRYTQQAARGPTLARAPRLARESARPPANSVSRSTGNFGAQHSAPPVRAGTQSASHGARHG